MNLSSMLGAAARSRTTPRPAQRGDAALTAGSPAARVWSLARDGVLSGLVGTAAMTATTWAEGRMRPGADGLIDYDASKHVVVATAHVLGLRPRTHRQRLALFVLAHWGYGSAVAVAHEALRERLPEKVTAPVFYAGCQTMAFVLFPTIGDTPPPWRWRRDVLLTSMGQHAIYTAAVATTSTALRQLRSSPMVGDHP